MTQIVDRKYIWRGFANGTGDWESFCRLRIYQPHPEQIVVVLSDDPESEGTSIANCAEYLLPKIAREFGLDSKISAWVHHQPQHSEAAGDVETSQVSLSISNSGSVQPLWSFVKKAKVENWICSKL